MGWGSGKGKSGVLDPAAGDVVDIDAGYNPFRGRMVLIDVSGLAHRASHRQAKQVVLEGTSPQQQLYVRRQLESIVAEGGTPVLVLDGRAYGPKAAERSRRRTDRSTQVALAQQLEQQPGKQAEAGRAWNRAAAPREEFWVWLMQHCIDSGIPFLVSPYEADAQLVALEQQLGPSQAVIWAASQDSDLVVFGATEVIYDWDSWKRTFRSVRLHEHLLGRRVSSPVAGEMSFEGWTYDRLLVLAILSGHDYLSLPRCSLKNAYEAMASTRLPPALVAPAPHPPLDERPAAWTTPEAIGQYAQPFLNRLPPTDRADALASVVASYRAVRHHPVYHLQTVGPDALDWCGLRVGVAVPLSTREQSGGVQWPASIVDVTLDSNANEATAWARGVLKEARSPHPSLHPPTPQLMCTRPLAQVNGVLHERRLAQQPVRPHDDGASVDESDSDAGGDDGDLPVAIDSSGVSLATVDSDPPALLRAFLVQRCGVDLYAKHSQLELRTFAKQLLQQGVPPILAPAHPILYGHSRGQRCLSVDAARTLHGEAAFGVVKQLTAQGLSFDEGTRNAYVPFKNVQARGYRLYNSSDGPSGVMRLGSRSHAHSHSLSVQRGCYEPAAGQKMEAVVIRMPVHASMRGIDHPVMLTVAFVGGRWELLLAPNSVCGCESGIECSHLYCLLLVLHVMQHSSSWTEFKQKVLVYDPALHPSGSAVWWPDVYDSAANARKAAEAQLPMDRKVLAPLPAAVPALPRPSAAHVSGANRDYHHSPPHLRVFRSLLPHPSLRRGTLAQIVRQEHGELVAPPPTAADAPAPGGDASSDEDDGGGGMAAAGQRGASPSPIGAGASAGSPSGSPMRSPMRQPQFGTSPGSGAMERSQGRGKRATRSRTARRG